MSEDITMVFNDDGTATISVKVNAADDDRLEAVIQASAKLNTEFYILAIENAVRERSK